MECKYKFRDKEKFDGKPYCTCFCELCRNLPLCDDDCQIYEDFKQLTSKTLEYEKYKKLAADFKDVNKQLGYKYLTIKDECKKLKKTYNNALIVIGSLRHVNELEKLLILGYRKALGEIETIAEEKKDCCFECKPMIKILDIINKAKGDN